MKIEKIDINLLKLAKYNPRKDLQSEDIEYQKIKRSIEEFGYVDPLIINKDMTVIGGNQRLKVLKELGYKKVDCVLLDLDKTKEKALNIALNKIEGEWDLPKLKDLLQELDTGELDMDITGFEYTDLEELMTQFHVPDENEKDDEVPDILEEPISKLGDLYKLGKHRLLCGDSTKIEDVEKLMNGKKADMIFTDPPYGINLDVSYSGMPNIWNKKEYLHKFKKPIEGDNSKFDASFIFKFFKIKEIFLWGANNYVDTLPNFGINGSWIVWDKRVEENLDRMYGSAFELCWSNVRHKKEIARIRYGGIFGTEKEPDKDKKRKHPTQKPVLLCEWFINKFSKLNDIIPDLFGGSGSTLIACEKLKRKCYMMEIDPYYIDVIIKRYENYTGNKAKLIEN